VEGVSVGDGRVSVGIGVSVGGVVLVGIGVLVDSGASAVQAAKVLATAVSTAPGGGVEGAGAQAARRRTTIRRIGFFICAPFSPPPWGDRQRLLSGEEEGQGHLTANVGVHG
jgi:hypothetical protein